MISPDTFQFTMLGIWQQFVVSVATLFCPVNASYGWHVNLIFCIFENWSCLAFVNKCGRQETQSQIDYIYPFFLIWSSRHSFKTKHQNSSIFGFLYLRFLFFLAFFRSSYQCALIFSISTLLLIEDLLLCCWVLFLWSHEKGWQQIFCCHISFREKY